MALNRWIGGAAAVAQVQTETVADTWANAQPDTLTATINNKDVVFTVGATETVSAVVAGMVAAWNASTVPEHAEITAVDADPDIVFTADIAGIPFILTLVADTAGDGDVSSVATTAATGPNHADSAANWSLGAVPVNTNEVIIEDSSVPILYGFDQSGVALASCDIKQSYTGTIGLPTQNANGYAEYREQYLKIDPGVLTIGEGGGTGSGRIKIDHGAEPQVITVLGSGARAEPGIPSILLKGSDGANTLAINRGDVGVAIFGGESAEYASLAIGYTTSQPTDARVITGGSVTLPVVDKSGGTLDLGAASLTTVTQSAGEMTLRSTSDIVNTLKLDGGICYDMGGVNTVGTLTIAEAAEYNHDKSHAARTITNITMVKGAIFTDTFGVTTQTYGFDLSLTKLEDVVIHLPPNKTWTPSAI